MTLKIKDAIEDPTSDIDHSPEVEGQVPKEGPLAVKTNLNVPPASPLNLERKAGKENEGVTTADVTKEGDTGTCSDWRWVQNDPEVSKGDSGYYRLQLVFII